MNYQYLQLDIKDYIGTIQIYRPEKRNAMDPQSWDELDQAVKELNTNPLVHVIVITGHDKTFVAGADIQWIHDRKPMDIYGLAVQDILLNVYRSQKPTIAAINGYALGGGCELALACDIRVGCVEAKFGQPEVNLGILPAGGGTQQLTKIVGLAKAKELILTGDIIDAEEAHRLGLLNHVVSKEILMDKTYEIARKIASKSAVTVKMLKIALNESPTSDLSSGLALEKSLQAVLFGTEDKKEGTRAFLEKRKPQFKGS
ncbi:enoyl-CoA hydratase/isomerase family protein [Alkalihalobacillus pseudalcaliphilus]|uniref:enoyl-CoA hydratase/isomerase family protein n=1 Tax=Alkalihalobacillus pseudalcaliphilus TaxID=79884 RepID=UPI00064DCF2B|nr:enoyl-CoA hydratase/isomerase family protein [Alkalihalobacillus pseudalcaliphilus]KMK76879.1 enoyl-CoA hydratase [Alkalihalobacillus pseudalcaliphilus]